MKKLIGSSLTVLALAMASNAAVLIDEPFTYADGALSSGLGTNAPGAVWTTHSGALGQIQVSGNQISLVTTDSEDVNRTLGVVYSNQTLFASFKANFSVLPTTTTYFAHFAQNNSTFRCRIWSTTTGAAAGKFRVGITSVSSTTANMVPIATDLDLSTEYKLVVRFLGGTNATLWINPTSESSIVNRADGTNDMTAIGSYTSLMFAFRQASGIGTMTIDDLLVGDQFSDVQTVGGPPSISGLVSTNIPANSSTGPMPFLVSDVETVASNLVVTATSDNTTLVPNNPSNLTLGGADGNRTLNVTPAASQEGTANIEVVVTDGNGEKATNNFTLNVGVPTISAIADQTVLEGSVKSVAFWVNDGETAPGSLTVTATSFNQSVLPDSNIGIINSGNTNRTLQLTNTAAGASVVTVTVSDGTFNIPTTFTLTVSGDNGILMEENFNYTDGSIVTNSLSFAPHNWTTHSASAGATGETQVASSKLYLTNVASEDINRWFTNAPYADTSGQIIFTRYVVNFSQLPTTTTYFQHTYGFSGFYRARVFSTTNGAAAGKLRLGISNGGNTPVVLSQDLSLNRSHVVITRYNTATSESTLWVDPASVASSNVTGSDLAGTGSTYGTAFRQSNGIGTMSIDDLRVGSTFSQVLTNLPVVLPTPESIAYSLSGSDLILSWTDPAFKLASSTNVVGPYLPVGGATSPYTNSMTGPQNFFRLVYP